MSTGLRCVSALLVPGQWRAGALTRYSFECVVGAPRLHQSVQPLKSARARLAAEAVAILAFACILPAVGGQTNSHPAERESLILRVPAGGSITAAGVGQILPDGSRLVFLPQVPAGASIATAAVTEPRQPRTERLGSRWRKAHGSLVAVVNGHDLFAFHFETVHPPRPDVNPIFARSGFIDAIRTRVGLVVSQAFPRLPVKHEHLYALWSAWTATEFEGRKMNFWDVLQGTTQIRCAGISAIWDGPVAGGFTAENVFYDRTVSPEKPVLREKWLVVAYAMPGEFAYNLFDVSLHQVCASSSPVTLKEYRYSGFAMRYPDAFYGDATLFMVSTGETDREKANHTAQRWVYMGGMIDGRQGGVAILSHPTNFRAPELVRLHPKTPFFCFSPSSAGDWQITPDRPYHAHYRMVVLDGPPERDRLERLWQAFASAPPATMAPPAK